MTREEAIDSLRLMLSYYAQLESEQAKRIVEALNIAIESLKQEPRRKGKWKIAYLDHESMGERPHLHYCSACNGITVFPYDYCPYCGADMREVTDERID